MATLATLPQKYLDLPLTTLVRERLTDAEVDKLLALTPAQIHAAAKIAWATGNRQRHGWLLHLGWILNRIEKVDAVV